MKKIIAYVPSFAMLVAMVAVAIEPAHAQDLNSLRAGVFTGSFGTVFRRILELFLLVAGITAFFFVLYGGFVYLTAGGDANKAGQGRTFIVNAIIGLVLIFVSYALIRYVLNFTTSGGSTAIF